MTVEEENMGIERKTVLVGIRIDGHSRELLNWALVKVAESEDCVIAVHVCRTSGRALKCKPLMDNYLEVYEGLCSVKKVYLAGRICTGISVRRTLVREAKKHSANTLVVGISKQNALMGRDSIARYCAKRLPPTTDVLAIHNGKIVFRRFNDNQLPGLGRDPKPSFSLTDGSSLVLSEFGDSEADTDISSFEVLTSVGSGDTRDEVSSLVSECTRRSSTSVLTGDIVAQKPGWPLLRRASSGIPQALHARELSVVQWAMSLPNRSAQKNQNPLAAVMESSSVLEGSNRIAFSSTNQLENSLEILLNANSPSCKWFSYEVLKRATSNFHSGNLIGKGGCNRVYKGVLSDGKLIAVKVQRSSKESRKDFVHEIEIISTISHKHIAPLLGVCIKDSHLISVYNFFKEGSLEENLHGNHKEKFVLPWEARFNSAVKIAEALSYLHAECSRPVIHRDVKSSNILLAENFEPRLSDFGLAIWGPISSSFLIQGDVVGTFGYLAPEYFMYGKVSDKIDVYAFGVVLLELLSGRKVIGYETPKGHESLVMWAKPLIESGNAAKILDTKLEKKFDEAQMRRMVLAATLCLTRAARLRPKMIEILKLLKGDKEMEKLLAKPQIKTLIEAENQDENDDEVYPNSSADLHLSVALLDVDDDSASLSSLEPGSFSFEEYLKERWSRSSSFNY